VSFPTRYLRALRVHLRKRSAATGDVAQGLGRTAVTDGMATLDLARVHERSLVALAAAQDFGRMGNAAIERAGFFFTQALMPLEAAQQLTRESNRRLQQRNDLLRRHARALAAGTRRLEREIKRRKTGEQVVRHGKDQYQKLFLESRTMQLKLRQLTRQIISAQEDERRKISRELHDEVVQTLVGINVQLTTLGRGASSGVDDLRMSIARTQKLVERSVNAVHRFARDLRPALLDDLGLIPALHAFSRNLAARKHLQIQLTAFGGVEALTIAKRTVLYRVAQEALTNVTRHAQATAVIITLSKIAGAIRLEIRDNGKAFPVGQTLKAGRHNRLGLVGMKERVEMVGGTLAIESTPGQGTNVCAEIPFGSVRQAA
jgi:signal transduction histidine kinase